MTLKTWGLLAGKFNVPQAITDMMAYVHRSDSPPDALPPEGGGRELGAPETARIYLTLRKCGMGHVEALDFPLNASHLLYCAEMELDGRIELMSLSLREAIRKAQAA